MDTVKGDAPREEILSLQGKTPLKPTISNRLWIADCGLWTNNLQT
jgi:hypothetical protein